MADITSARSKLNTDEVAQDKPITEALHTKIGADINYLIDERDSLRSDVDDNTSDISALITENNKLGGGVVLRRVTFGTATPPDDPFNIDTIYLAKDLQAGITYLVYKAEGSGILDFSANVNVGVNPTTWDVGTVHVSRDGVTYRVHWAVFNYVSMSDV